MSEPRYPNESAAYRKAREALLKDEEELIDKTKALAAKRRQLSSGGQIKEDYTFEWASDGKLGRRVKVSELFGEKDTHPLFLDVRAELGQALSLLHLADGWVRPDLVFGFAGCGLCGDRQGAGREDQCLGEGTWVVTDPAGLRFRVAIPGGLPVARATTTTCSSGASRHSWGAQTNSALPRVGPCHTS